MIAYDREVAFVRKEVLFLFLLVYSFLTLLLECRYLPFLFLAINWNFSIHQFSRAFHNRTLMTLGAESICWLLLML